MIWKRDGCGAIGSSPALCYTVRGAGRGPVFAAIGFRG